jgi:DNA-binding IclR family transcriptional regulator
LPEGVKMIRAVERTFEVLRTLRQLKDASVAELEQATGLPPPGSGRYAGKKIF